MHIPFRRSVLTLSLATVITACGGGGKDAAELAGIVDVVSVVASAGGAQAGQAIQAAPVSTGVLTQAPVVVAASTTVDAGVGVAVGVGVSTDLPVAAVSPADHSVVAASSSDIVVSGAVSGVVVPAAGVVTVTPVVPVTSATVVAPIVPVTQVQTVAPGQPVVPVTPVAPTTPTTPTLTTTPTWVVCASENDLCTFSGTRTVRYGTSTAYYARLATEQTPCDNATFGDPVSGQAKQCSVLVDIVTSSAGRAVAPLGVYLGAESGGVGRVNDYATWLGRRPQRALEFLSNDNWQAIEDAASRDAWVWKPTGLAMTFSVPMLPGDNSSTMAAGARGDYDQHFRTIAANFVRDGQPDAIVRIGWEFNYGWYPWAAGANLQDFVTYWRRIVDVMRTVPNQNFRFDWCPAIGQGDIDIAKAYPGDAYVDIIGMDVYNQTWANPVPSSDALWQTLLTQRFGLQWHRNFGLTHGKPIAYPEWGTGIRPDGHGLGDDPRFIEHMAAWIADNDVAYHDYWDYQAPDYDARLSNGNFPQAGAAFKAAFGQ